ncbi:MurR/RpiR family transcriptional regulator [Gracilibacillus caseinilyticus]|uniref:MurR/RpiR family transcriptional regulator n=1 Tax=Gracilibacillus caseinilyticus TaxID=2932256 RepID=A0ABY4F051_9BACI|nr:MurR/RpiR family transcriptional regulator [Gracilibacillus caseinilyticus]UOQ49289.1 MurR/RpiR family transcriptional regulator [Gracilibacillus caseinilyticus]
MKNKRQTCLDQVRRNYPKFSVTERKIADYILKNPNQIIHSSINQLAEDLHVADSTVFRFCKRIGYKGYQAMKIALASEVVSSLQDIHEKVDQGDSVETVASKVFRSNMNALEETLQIIDEEEIRKAVKSLTTARFVHFFGTGGSNVVAIDAYHKFVRTGIAVQAVSDTHMQLMAASQLEKGDCAILISHSGSSKDIIHILNVLKEKNVTTIAITNFAKSTLSAAADIALYTSSVETDFRAEAFSSRIAQLSLLDLLYVNVLMEKGEEGQEAIRNMREAMIVKRI